MRKILLFIVMLFLFVNNVSAANCELEDSQGFCLVMTTHDKIDGTDYFGSELEQPPSNTYFKVSTDNEILYCSNVLLSTNNLTNDIEPIDKRCSAITDVRKSLIYVYEYGYGENVKSGEYRYNSDYLTGNNYHDYYITQTAVWHFIPPTEEWLLEQGDWDNFWFNAGYDFTAGTYYGQKYNTVTKATNLIKAATTAATATPSLEIESSNTSMNITSDGEYYISDAITIKGKYLTFETKVTVEGITGAIITDSTFKTISDGIISNGTVPSFESTIYVKVPVENVESANVTIKLNVTSKSAFNDNSKIIECDPHVNNYLDTDEGIYDQSMIKYVPEYTTLTEEITLYAQKYSVKISKRDIRNALLPGATFVVKKGNEVIETWNTTSEVKSLLLAPGTYTLSETKVPKGYISTKSTITFTIDTSGIVYIDAKPVEEITVTNEPIMVTISKKKITGDEELAGATLRITDKNGNIVKDIQGNNLEWTSTTEEKKIHLAAGTYILEEILAPEGYIGSSNKIEFTLDNNGQTFVAGQKVDEVIIRNEPILVTISKQAIIGSSELAGAKLKITDLDGNIAKDIEGNNLEWISTTEAKEFHLAAGTYILEETVAPEGYIKLTNKIEFTIAEDGSVLLDDEDVKKIVVTNKPIIVSISKRSINSNNELKGATLKITDKDGNVVKDINGKKLEWTSTTEAKEFHLVAGTYILSETKAPKGYELSEKMIMFTVTSDGKVLIDGKEVKDNMIVFENTPEPEDKKTGSTALYIALSVGTVAIGTVTFLFLRKKK